MNILMLAPYPPYPPYGGGAMRIYQLVRGLAARHTVTCLTFAPDAAAEQALAPLHAICRVLVVRGPAARSPLRRAWTTLMSTLPDMALRNASGAYAAVLEQQLRDERFDVIQAESIEMAGYLRELGAQFKTPRSTHNSKLKRPEPTQNPKLILDQFNAEFLLQRRAFLTDIRRPRRWHAAGYSLAQWLKLARYERQVMRRCNAVVAVSDEDRHTLHRLAPSTPIGIVPNGVDTAHFSRTAVARERAGPFVLQNATLVFSGTLDYRPNIDAVGWFAHEVLPRIQARLPDVRLLVVGRRPAPALQALAAAGSITLTGEVPDARPYIAGAAVYVVPMRIGGGVRLKLLEALALEAPVVSSNMGAEGVAGLHGGEHCLLADDPAEFASAVLHLIDDPAAGQRLGAAGRMLVCERYDWSALVPQLEALYTQLSGDKR
jgi:glycosyltransferase involved in cell wall biosynthesis